MGKEREREREKEAVEVIEGEKGSKKLKRE